MLVSTRSAAVVEAPSRLQLAIREWQRQLIAMAEAAQSARATHSATGGG
jgi:capsular polysaccharide biosynthesis protein